MRSHGERKEESHVDESGRTGEIRERNAKDEAIVYLEWYEKPTTGCMTY